jgi:hypothetical protein
MDNQRDYQKSSLEKAIKIYGNSKEALCEQLGITKHHLHYYYGPKSKGLLQPHHCLRLTELFPTWFMAERLHPNVYPADVARLIRKKLKSKK